MGRTWAMRKPFFLMAGARWDVEAKVASAGGLLNTDTKTVSSVSWEISPSVDRYVIVCVSAVLKAGGTNGQITGVTVDGNTATAAVKQNVSAPGQVCAAIYYCNLPTGASGDVAVSFGDDVTGYGVMIHTVSRNGLSTGFNIVGTASYQSDTDQAPDITVTTEEDCLLLGVSGTYYYGAYPTIDLFHDGYGLSEHTVGGSGFLMDCSLEEESDPATIVISATTTQPVEPWTLIGASIGV